MIKHPTKFGYKQSGYFYYSDYYFEFFYIGKIYRKWTDHILKCGIELDIKYDKDTTEYVKNSGYNPDIIHFSDDLYKITWNLRQELRKIKMENGYIRHATCNYELHKKQKEHITKLFCIDGWEKEEAYNTDNFDMFKYNNTNPPEEGMSNQYGDIKKYTKPWVNYLTFQHSRIIVQFQLEDYVKSLRENKLNRILCM